MATLEELLDQLADETSFAQMRYDQIQHEDDLEELGEREYEVFFVLEHEFDGTWSCGYQVQQDETYEWADEDLMRAGHTPRAAVEAMIEAMEEVKQRVANRIVSGPM